MWIEMDGYLRNLNAAKIIRVKDKMIVVEYTDGSRALVEEYSTKEEAKEALADLLQILNA